MEAVQEKIIRNIRSSYLSIFDPCFEFSAIKRNELEQNFTAECAMTIKYL